MGNSQSCELLHLIIITLFVIQVCIQVNLVLSTELIM